MSSLFIHPISFKKSIFRRSLIIVACTVFLCSLDVRQEHGEIKVISIPREAGKPAPLFFLLFTSQSLGSSVLLKQGEWYSIVINTVLSFSVIKCKYPVERDIPVCFDTFQRVFGCCTSIMFVITPRRELKKLN